MRRHISSSKFSWTSILQRWNSSPVLCPKDKVWKYNSPATYSEIHAYSPRIIRQIGRQSVGRPWYLIYFSKQSTHQSPNQGNCICCAPQTIIYNDPEGKSTKNFTLPPLRKRHNKTPAKSHALVDTTPEHQPPNPENSLPNKDPTENWLYLSSKVFQIKCELQSVVYFSWLLRFVQIWQIKRIFYWWRLFSSLPLTTGLMIAKVLGTSPFHLFSLDKAQTKSKNKMYKAILKHLKGRDIVSKCSSSVIASNFGYSRLRFVHNEAPSPAPPIIKKGILNKVTHFFTKESITVDDPNFNRWKVVTGEKLLVFWNISIITIISASFLVQIRYAAI